MMFIILMYVFHSAPSDYVANSELLTFSPMNMRFSLVVGIVNDDIVEPEESFTARAEVVSTDAARLTIRPEQSIVTIMDDDGKQI